MTVHQILAPIRNHARLSPLERLDVHGIDLLNALVGALDGAEPAVERHVAEALEVLAPRLYDLWDAAGTIAPRPAWLAPLASYAHGEG
jgi:hypothetical protein